MSKLPRLKFKQMEKQKATERCDSLPGCNYGIWQASSEFAFTTDAVFLAAFPHLVRQARVLELGAGTGAISLLLAARGAAKVVGIDCNQQVVALMQRSIEDNDLSERVEARVLDLKQLPTQFVAESFDLVVANPPYRIGGKRRQVGEAACHEITATLADFFRAAAYAVKYRGRFALVQLPERFTASLTLAQSCGFELKKLQWVHSFVEKPAWVFLAEFVKGGAPGLAVLPPLIMYKPDGTHTQQTLAYYGLRTEEKQ